MLWIYDDAIAKDLSSAIDEEGGANSCVKVIEPDEILGLVAQMQEDRIAFPLLCLTRDPDYSIDTNRTNFTAMKKGVPIGYDSDHNTLYLEKVIPVNLSYTLNILTTNTADADEMLKEILFRYTSMYFVTVDVPYEIDQRSIRIGIEIEPGSIKKTSASLEYIKSGALYQTSLQLQCQGAVLLSYTPKHMGRIIVDKTITVK